MKRSCTWMSRIRSMARRSTVTKNYTAKIIRKRFTPKQARRRRKRLSRKSGNRNRTHRLPRILHRITIRHGIIRLAEMTAAETVARVNTAEIAVGTGVGIADAADAGDGLDADAAGAAAAHHPVGNRKVETAVATFRLRNMRLHPVTGTRAAGTKIAVRMTGGTDAAVSAERIAETIVGRAHRSKNLKTKSYCQASRWQSTGVSPRRRHLSWHQ